MYRSAVFCHGVLCITLSRMGEYKAEVSHTSSPSFHCRDYRVIHSDQIDYINPMDSSGEIKFRT